MAPTRIPLILTRPQRQAARFADRLRNRLPDADIMISPVLSIRCRPVPDLTGVGGVIFSSGNGVRCLAEKSPHRGAAFCVGKRTTAEALRLGFDATCRGANAEELIAALLAEPPTGPLAHIRGEVARGAIAERLTDGGLPCAEVIAYDQLPLPLNALALQALAGESPVLLPLFSPRSARLVGEAAKTAKAPLFLAALSPAVAEAWAGPGPVDVKVAATPDAEALMLALDPLFAAARHLEAGDSAR